MYGNRTLRIGSWVKKVAKSLVISIFSIFACWLVFTGFLAFAFGGNPFDNNPFDDTVFNQKQWFSDENCSDGSNHRGRMAQDIINHHLREGMSQQEIVRTLGTPRQFSAFEFTNYYRGNKFYCVDMPSSKNPQPLIVWGYFLGEELDMAWGIDHAELYIYFRNGQYVGSRIGWPR